MFFAKFKLIIELRIHDKNITFIILYLYGFLSILVHCIIEQ